MEKFGKRLREARKEKGMSQIALAKKLKVNQSTLSGWESGKFQPSFELVRQIALILECDTNYLFGVFDEH